MSKLSGITARLRGINTQYEPTAELLSSRGRAELFRLLFGPAHRELHVRELERRTGLSDATVRQELKKLSRLGVVEARRDGNRTCYRANDAHPLYPDIRNLVLKTSGLTDVLREVLDRAGDIKLAFVFGSIAGDTAKGHSDIDLMVIGTISLRQLSKRLSGLEAKLGREVNPHVLTPEEFARHAGERNHFITAVLKGPWLFVVGSEDVLRKLGR
jgi:DNA-binding transcriptional ArsR family regulator